MGLNRVDVEIVVSLGRATRKWSQDQNKWLTIQDYHEKKFRIIKGLRRLSH